MKKYEAVKEGDLIVGEDYFDTPFEFGTKMTFLRRDGESLVFKQVLNKDPHYLEQEDGTTHFPIQSDPFYREV